MTSCSYVFKNFTDLNEYESEEVLLGRNDEYVRRWMTRDCIITHEDHQHFMLALKRSCDRVFFRVERAGRFVGVYSLTDIQGGCGVGGFWVTPYARDCLLSLNVVFHSIAYVFDACAIERLRGYQLVDNTAVAKLNMLLGFSPALPPTNANPRMTYFEMTRVFWKHSASCQPKLLKLIDLMERRNEI